ncbi:hypothetical protein Dacet_2235 [Denitrovibrio acetiphilus DSM 12809]|uniref:DUF1320 domain-containing protein n=1 Tax=Denitrovibrio acetiphilus (strain DSM 12809 / NBRC 114555 / N2460) TaxID=522772 RepID=D4H2X4_DENA2|nr:hypothetical protein [Denitrovibrio acetiphilus]ADD68997.1 hypothetical protein Dacet_2235 [Denitrovibrio acetiphilus DSM 12809]
MLIDIYELQDCIQAEDYDAICRGDDAVAEESLESARAYVGLAAEKFGVEYDEEDPALRLAVKKWALAQMYIFAAEWETAERYKSECNEVLTPLAPSAETGGKIFSHTTPGSISWKGYY